MPLWPAPSEHLGHTIKALAVAIASLPGEVSTFAGLLHVGPLALDHLTAQLKKTLRRHIALYDARDALLVTFRNDAQCRIRLRIALPRQFRYYVAKYGDFRRTIRRIVLFGGILLRS